MPKQNRTGKLPLRPGKGLKMMKKYKTIKKMVKKEK